MEEKVNIESITNQIINADCMDILKEIPQIWKEVQKGNGLSWVLNGKKKNEKK